MPLRSRNQKESDRKVRLARTQVEEAVSRLTGLLDIVEEQATEAKEHLDERRTG